MTGHRNRFRAARVPHQHPSDKVVLKKRNPFEKEDGSISGVDSFLIVYSIPSSLLNRHITRNLQWSGQEEASSHQSAGSTDAASSLNPPLKFSLSYQVNEFIISILNSSQTEDQTPSATQFQFLNGTAVFTALNSKNFPETLGFMNLLSCLHVNKDTHNTEFRISLTEVIRTFEERKAIGELAPDGAFTIRASVQFADFPSPELEYLIQQHEHHISGVHAPDGPLPTVSHSTNEDPLPARRRSSKRRTNEFIGLENQGATCYLNSLLQTLFHLREFRRLICTIPPIDSRKENDTAAADQSNGNATSQKEDPTDSDALNPQKNCVVALQTLFYNMTRSLSNNPVTPNSPTSNKPVRTSAVTTEDLTKSFGWDEEDVFAQHDVQELFSKLLEKLEQQLEAAKLPNYIQQLFEGKEQRYIKCLRVPYESKNNQAYRDIQLTVENCKNLYESFDKYTEAEVMSGDNAYRTEKYGLQDAKMGSIFLSFPPVLVLHLKRFAFDFMTGFMKKVDDRFEFDEQINLHKYLDPESMQDQDDAEYVLYSVMVQAGSLEIGHYYNYIRPMTEISQQRNDQRSLDEMIQSSAWYEFNDENVSVVDKQLAVDSNFGGDNTHSSAYMLVYVRKSMVPDLMCSFGKEIFPPHVLSIIEKQQEALEKKRRKQEQNRRQARFELVLDSWLQERNMEREFIDLYPLAPSLNGDGTRSGVRLSKEMLQKYTAPTVVCTKSTSFGELEDSIRRTLQIRPKTKIHLWNYTRRENATSRPMVLLSSSRDTPLNHTPALKGEIKDTQPYSTRLFVRACPSESESSEDEKVLLFFKLLPRRGRLEYLRSMWVHKNTLLSALLNAYKQLLRECPLEQIFYEEVDVSESGIEQRNLSRTVNQEGLGSGDILVLCEKGVSLETVRDKYAAISNTIRITISNTDNDKEFYVINVRKDLPLEEFCDVVSSAVQWPSNQLRFYGYNDNEDAYDTIPFRTKKVRIVNDMIVDQEDDFYLQYQKVDEPVKVLESRVEFTLHFYDGQSESETLNLSSSPHDTLEDVLAESQEFERLGIPITDVEVRYISRHRIEGPISLNSSVESIEKKFYGDAFPHYYLRLQQVMPEVDTEIWTPVEVTHFSVGLSRLQYIDCPFLMNVNLTWTAAELRKAINVHLPPKIRELTANSRLAFIQKDHSRIYLKDDDILREKATETSTHLGIERNPITQQPKALQIS